MNVLTNSAVHKLHVINSNVSIKAGPNHPYNTDLKLLCLVESNSCFFPILRLLQQLKNLGQKISYSFKMF